MHRAREHCVHAVRTRAERCAGQRSHLIAQPRRSPSRQELERDRAEREHVRRRAPGLSRDTLRCAVGTADRGPQAEPIERVDDAESRGTRFVWRDEDVAGVQGAMPHACLARGVDGRAELGDERKGLVEGRRRIVPHGDIERFGGDVFLCPVGDGPLDSGGNRFDDGRVDEACLDRAPELVRKRARLFRCEIEPECLDRDESIARRLVCPVDGTKCADTDLMQHPEGAERRWGRESSRVVSGQVPCSSCRCESGKKCNTLWPRCDGFWWPFQKRRTGGSGIQPPFSRVEVAVAVFLTCFRRL